MIDISKEKPVRLTRAPKVFRELLPENKSGGDTAISTWFRWMKAGCRAANGKIVQLETVRVAGALCTTREAVLRFIVRLNNEEPGDVTPQRRQVERQAAQHTLAAAGI